MTQKSINRTSRLAAAMLLVATSLSTAFAASTTVSVNFGSNMSAMSSQGLGVDSAVYDGSMLESGIGSVLANAGIKAVRYPGGSYADIFNWQTTTVNGGAYIDTSDTFDSFMSTVVNPAGAKAIITVNYGSNPANNAGGDPTVAAAWVKYANKTKGYGITYWEIGNEVGGNGYYGDPGWEYDLHYPFYNGLRGGQPSLSPATYGQNAVTFINDMKAQDSTIKCGVGIDQPGGWPDTASPSYNQQLLANCGSVIDFVIIHWYPGGTAAQLLQTPLQCAGIVSSVKTELNSYAGSRASQIQLLITETGAGSVTGTATALFAADDYLSWLENGVQNVDYQELHNGFLDSSDNLLGPAYGSKMAGTLAVSGDTFVTTSSGTTMVAAHATKKANGHFDVMLINKDPANAYTTTVNVSGATLATSGTLYSCNGSSVSQSTLSGIGASSFSITVPAYNMIVVDIAAGSGGGGSVPAGTYSLKNRADSLVVDNLGSTANGATVGQWADGTSNNQKYTLSYDSSGYAHLMCVTGSEYLDSLAHTGNGSQVGQWASSTSANQQWTLTATDSGYYKIINRANGLCLDTGALTTNGSILQFWGSSSSYNQQWQFIAP